MTSLRILVIDDSEFVRAVAAASLEERGHTVVLADGPLEINSALGGVLPDAALVDVGFPGISPERLATILRADLAGVPYLVFSDRKEAELASLVDLLGARGYVPKKAGASLVERVEALCGEVAAKQSA